MFYGYTGNVLEINLATKEVLRRELDPSGAKMFLGGLGYGIKILYDEVGPNVEALSPDNVLIIATGPLTGVGAPTSGRTHIVTKSPLTGGIGMGNFGGVWGGQLKHAGLDAIIVRKNSDSPVYLLINDDCAELRSAEHLWGKDNWETTDALKEELGDDISVLSIGQAGENLVRFACPVIDYDHAPGRSHAGCIMGAKRLKAIAVKGTKEIPISKPEEFNKAVREARDRIKNYPERGDRPTTGSNFQVKDAAKLGIASVRNYQSVVVPPDSEIWELPSSARKHLKTELGRYGDNCPMAPRYGCDLVAKVKDGKFAGLEVGGVCYSLPSWEWGANLGIKSYPAMWKCRELCQRYGMNQTGPTPFVMELFERGIITKDDTDGLDLQWGNEDAIMEMLHKIAYREGFGDLVAEGSLRIAKRIGKGAEKRLTIIKGLNYTGQDPRVDFISASRLGFIVSPRGDDLNTTHTIYETFPAWAAKAGWKKDKYLHWFIEEWLDMFKEVKERVFGLPPRADALVGARTFLDSDRTSALKGEALSDQVYEAKAALTKWHGELTSVYDSLGLCMFAGNRWSALGPTHYAKLYSASTGWQTTPRELMKAGERIFNLMRAYIVREGFTREDDDWPERFYSESVPDGPTKGAMLDRDKISKLLDKYYELVGWDKNSGWPKKEKLVELGLTEVAGELEKIGKLAR